MTADASEVKYQRLRDSIEVSKHELKVVKATTEALGSGWVHTAELLQQALALIEEQRREISWLRTSQATFKLQEKLNSPEGS